MSKAEAIAECLGELDPDPRLKIRYVQFPIPMKASLSDENGTRLAKNPVSYVLNVYGEEKEEEKFLSTNKLPFLMAAKIVRKRIQLMKKDLKIFARDVELDKNFCRGIDPLLLNLDDEFDIDSEIVARVAGKMFFEEKKPLPEIKEFLTMDASEIVEKFGIEFVKKSCIYK